MSAENRKRIKYVLIVGVILIAAYNSVYFESLDTVHSQTQQADFDPAAYATDFWENRLINNLTGAVDVASLLDLLATDMKQAVETYARTLGIASTHAYLVKGNGRIQAIIDGGLLLSVRPPDTRPDVLLLTNYIFGNAIRDASGLIDVSEFPSSMDFNNTSVEINRIVKERVVPGIIEHAVVGKSVTFIGATEVSEDEPDLKPLPVVPIQVEFE